MNETMGWVLGLGVGVLLGAGGVFLWARRRLAEALTRVHHLDQVRQQELQHTSMARRQVEGLQREVGELRHLMARRGLALPPRPAGEAVASVDADITQPDGLPADGFQPTQLIQRPRA